ncbi:MAG: ankyrin repeat domain-containing protein, partial [Treponema sp.]|nr:ankyrin repeat domain-containing protein [Treponema sp.]
MTFLKYISFFHFLKALIILVLCFILSFCGSTPPVAPVEAPLKPQEQTTVSPTPKSQDDVWSVLRTGNTEKSKAFFTGEVDVHTTDTEGKTPLHYAAETKNSQLAAFFLAIGAEVDALDKQQRTPLAISIGLEDPSVTRILVAGGADIFHSMPGNTTPAEESLKNLTLLTEVIRTESSIKKTSAEGKNLLDIALSHPESLLYMQSAEQLILKGAYSGDPLFAYLAPAVRTSNYNIRIADGITPLHFAARQGYLGLIQFLIDRDADVNLKTASGSTALHEAAMSGNMNALRILIENGADINAQDAKGNSVMHIAIPFASHQAILSLLLESGANPNLRDEHGESPLHIVIKLNRVPDTLQTLLNGKADVSIRNIEGKTPLFLAIEEGKGTYISLLLEARADIFAADNSGLTPFEKVLTEKSPLLPLLITTETVLQSDGMGNTILHIAVKNHADTGTISSILEKGAFIDARNKEGDTSLHIAVQQDDERTGSILLSRGADIFAANASGNSPLYTAFFSPDHRVRQWLLTKDTLTAQDGLGNTALHYAAQWKLDRYIPLMVEIGSNIDAQNATGETPLFTAVRYNLPSTVRTLTTSGALINKRDKVGNTALHAAIRWRSMDAGTALISLNIDVNAHALNGKTALHDAVRLGYTDMEILLIENGADIDVRDADGNTPLMEAIAGGFIEPVRRLTALGAGVNARNTTGDTPLHMAVKMNRQDIATALLNLSASIHARNAQAQTPFRLALITSPDMTALLLADDRVLLADDYGLSPLHIAISNKAPVPMIEAIIGQHAELSAVDSEGKTPLRLAMEQAYWDIAAVLAQAGSDVFADAVDGRNPARLSLEQGRTAIVALFSNQEIHKTDRSGNTILHYAAQYGTIEEVRQLLELGADKTMQNISGDTPADIAARWKRQ